MRVSNLLIMGALSALVFTGCTNNDDNSEWLDSNSVTFNSRIDGLQTKASKEPVSGMVRGADDRIGLRSRRTVSGIFTGETG